MAEDLVQELIIRVRTDGSTQIEKLTKALDGVGTTSVAVARKTASVHPEIEKINALLSKSADAYARTGQVGTRNLAQISVALKELETMHGRNIDAANRLSSSQKEAWRSLQSTYDDGIRKQRVFNTELKKISASTGEFYTLEGAIKSISPAIAKATIAIGLMVAAFTAGYQAARKLDEWLEKNATGWIAWRNNAVGSVKGFFAEIAAQTSRLRITWVGGMPIAHVGPLKQATLSQKGATDYELAHGQGLTTRQDAGMLAGMVRYDQAIAKMAGDSGGLQVLKKYEGQIRGLIEVFKDAGWTIPPEILKWEKALDGGENAVKRVAKALKELKPLFDLPTGRTFGEGRDIAIGTQFNKNVSSFEKVWGTAEEFDARMEDFKDAMREAAKPFDREMAKAAEKIRQEMETSVAIFKGGMTDVFSDLALTGGANFGDMAGAALIASVRRGTGVLTDILGEAVIGAFGGETAPRPGETQAEADMRRKETVGKISTVVEGVMGGISSIGANSKGQMNDTQLITSTTMTGASIGSMIPVVGTVIGAVVGLLVGAVMAGLSSVGDNYAYARIGIADGVGSFAGNKNVSSAAERDALQQLQETFDEFYSGYLKILLKFPMEVLPNILETMDITPTLGNKSLGADFGDAASKMFWQDFERYIKGGLPREIAGRFEGYFAEAFTGLGMSQERFNAIWGDLQAMDPKKAMANLALLADAVLAFNSSMEFFSTPLDTTVGAGFDIRPGLTQRVYEEGNRSFAGQLGIDDDKIVRLGSALANLTGEAQIQAASELGKMLEERMQKEKDFLASIIAGIEEIDRSFQAAIQNLTLEGMVKEDGTTDYQAQADYLMKYVEELRGQMALATSPEEVQRLSQELLNTILQIRQIGASAGGENGENYRVWALEQLEVIRREAVDRMNALAAEVEAANGAFLNAIQGFIDAFMGATDQLNGNPKEDDVTRDDPSAPGGPRDDDEYRRMSLTNQELSNDYLARIADAVEEGQTINVTLPPTVTRSTFEKEVVAGRSGGL